MAEATVLMDKITQRIKKQQKTVGISSDVGSKRNTIEKSEVLIL
jgi:hypothetical protein